MTDTGSGKRTAAHPSTSLVEIDGYRAVEHALYRGLEAWTRREGARWLRPGVVAGNGRAERFWSGLSFVEVRERRDVEMGLRIQTVRVLAKPLAGGTRNDYRALVPRDRADN